MALDTQSTIAIIALLVTCPSTIWLLYKFYVRRNRHENKSLLPTHTSYPSAPRSTQNTLHQHQRYYAWSLHTTVMLEDLATAFNHDTRAMRA
ncbi:hypothetical protein ACET3X_002331 [Alternaria dauci]|uniref:Uncharacterized protein n=1 Tax=Alternaria dauci TaxID=48095 RepID=A0ABR3UPP8_9PLEO